MNCCDGQCDELTTLTAEWIGARVLSGGIVVWCGVKWRGVPMLVRVVIVVMKWVRDCRRERRAVKMIDVCKWPGCGCVDAMKRRIENVAPQLAAWATWCHSAPSPVAQSKSDGV